MRIRMLTPTLIVGLALSVVLAACGNASSTAKQSSTGGTTATTASQQSLTENDPVTAPGVTGSSIQVATITSKTNLLGGDFGDFAYGVQAYFDYQNSRGGIYGRKLKIVKNRDDQMVQGQQEISASLSSDNAFATFIATPLLSGPGVQSLDLHHQPTFIWNINPEMIGHDNVFGTVGALCFSCYTTAYPFLAQQLHINKVAVIAYGVTASSKECADGVKKSFEKYPAAQVVFFDNALQFAQADLSADVGQLDAAGAQLIFTCIDQKESVILGKELAKEQSKAVQLLPNSYDQGFIAANAQYLEGDIVETQIAAFEYKPVIPEEQTMMTWLNDDHFPLDELSSEGWVAANEFVTGLKLAGPHFTQQQLINALNSDTNVDANGMIVPIDWTRQHNDPAGPNGTINAANQGHYNCSSDVRIHNGKFVPFADVPAGKQWVCLPNGQPSTLPASATYMSFASGG